MSSLTITPLPGLPEIASGADLAVLIAAAARRARLTAEAGDIFVVAQKIVSKAEGRVVQLGAVTPSAKARAWAEEWGKDARVVELVLAESATILRMERGIIIAETRHGYICANAGVDVSNAADATAILLPLNPDASARTLQAALSRAFGVPVAVIVSDTFGRAWREGLVNIALGVAGMAPLQDLRGRKDANGRELAATIIATADEVAAAAELVMGKDKNIPVAILSGLALGGVPGSGKDLLRAKSLDLFR